MAGTVEGIGQCTLTPQQLVHPVVLVCLTAKQVPPTRTPPNRPSALSSPVGHPASPSRQEAGLKAMAANLSLFTDTVRGIHNCEQLPHPPPNSRATRACITRRRRRPHRCWWRLARCAARQRCTAQHHATLLSYFSPCGALCTPQCQAVFSDPSLLTHSRRTFSLTGPLLARGTPRSRPCWPPPRWVVGWCVGSCCFTVSHHSTGTPSLSIGRVSPHAAFLCVLASGRER